MNTNSIEHLVDSSSGFSIVTGKFEKFLEVAVEPLSSLFVCYSPLQTRCLVEETRFNKAAAAVGQIQEPGKEKEADRGLISFTVPGSPARPTQGVMEIHFSGASEGIACQVMVEQKNVRCLMRAESAPKRMRMRRFRNRLARRLANRGMALDDFEVAP